MFSGLHFRLLGEYRDGKMFPLQKIFSINKYNKQLEELSRSNVEMNRHNDVMVPGNVRIFQKVGTGMKFKKKLGVFLWFFYFFKYGLTVT